MSQVEKTVKAGGGGVSTSEIKWAIGELEWSALMNVLDKTVCILIYFLFCSHFLYHRVTTLVMFIEDHSYI